MGRRGADGDGLGPASIAWEPARRALGRLFTRANVRALPEDQSRPTARFQAAEAITLPLPAAGAGEETWKPSAVVSQTAIPSAAPGSQNRHLLPTVQFIAPNCALEPPECRRMPPPVSADACRTESAALMEPREAVRLPDEFLALLSAPLLVRSCSLLPLPAVSALSGLRLPAWKANAVRIPHLPAPRVRWGGDAVLGRMALTRRGRAAPSDVPPAEAFRPEKRRLAEAAGALPEDVTLLGVYPGVPILAVSRIVVEEEGARLRLWLKPDVLRGRGGRRLITLLVGRRVSDGKMLQAAL